MSKLLELKVATDRHDLAKLLGVKTGMLTYAIYVTPEANRYVRFKIPKKHGGDRELCAPTADLMLIQRRLSKLLQDCVDEINIANGHKEDGKHFGIAHGFKRKHTTMTNGRVHVRRRFVFNADLHDFFGTINFGRVRGFFLKDKNFSLQPVVATTIAQIACFENKLPQGSPCSPVISNLISHPLDIRLARVASKHGISYTRYADDLTFSTNKPVFPVEVASPLGLHGWVPGPELDSTVTTSGFEFNPIKTRLQYRDSRQEVTGLTVNRKVNVPATYRNTVRAMVSTLFKKGSFEFIYRKRDATGAIVSETRQLGKNSQLLGMLAYVDQVDLFNERLARANDRDPEPTLGRTKQFRRFLYFDAFFAAPRPIIVCEGKTDNVYMRCAIRRLGASYPRLFADEKLLVRFFKYSESRTGKIMDLTGGVGGICKLLKSYHEDIKFYFKAPLSQHPVIVLIDNDSGANSIYEAVAGITMQKKPQGRRDFIYVTGNLYIVPTPFGPRNTPTAIEDFFDTKTLEKELNLKTFNRKNNVEDSEKFYGKAAFARDVVAKEFGTIDFSKFKAILDRIENVLDDYQVRRLTM
jgi:RNA-directed DNA polymerase